MKIVRLIAIYWLGTSRKREISEQKSRGDCGRKSGINRRENRGEIEINNASVLTLVSDLNNRGAFLSRTPLGTNLIARVPNTKRVREITGELPRCAKATAVLLLCGIEIARSITVLLKAASSPARKSSLCGGYKQRISSRLEAAYSLNVRCSRQQRGRSGIPRGSGGIVKRRGHRLHRGDCSSSCSHHRTSRCNHSARKHPADRAGRHGQGKRKYLAFAGRHFDLYYV